MVRPTLFRLMPSVALADSRAMVSFGLDELMVSVPEVRLRDCGRAMELSMMAERLSAETAHEWGIVNRLYDDNDALIDGAVAAGFHYLSDADARPAGAAHPLSNLWDNGADPVAEFDNVMRVRRIALERFGTGNLPAGLALSELEQVLAPIYFYHRYQLDAVLKSVGGALYRHALNGDGVARVSALDPARQRQALSSALAVLSPASLDLPEALLQLLAPTAPEYATSIESFGTRTAPVFDAMSAAATVAQQVFAGLLQRERCARLVDFKRRDDAQLGFEDVLAALDGAVFPTRLSLNARHAELQRVVQETYIRELLRAAADQRTSPSVALRLEAHLEDLAGRLSSSASPDSKQRRHLALLARRVTRYMTRESDAPATLAAPLDPPPGSPIGAQATYACSHASEWSISRRSE